MKSPTEQARKHDGLEAWEALRLRALGPLRRERRLLRGPLDNCCIDSSLPPLLVADPFVHSQAGPGSSSLAIHYNVENQGRHVRDLLLMTVPWGQATYNLRRT